MVPHTSRTVTLGELTAHLDSPDPAAMLLGYWDAPALVVDVEGGDVDVRTGRCLRSLPGVTVAIAHRAASVRGPGLGDFDILVADVGDDSDPGLGWVVPPGGVDSAVSTLQQRVGASPIASVGLVQLLRMSARLDVVDGLTAESFTYSTLQAGPEFAAWIAARRPASGAHVNPEPLRVTRRDRVLTLTFCRPEIRNAFGFEVRDALVEALQLVAADGSIESVVLRGDGPSFCSGGDLREFGTAVDPATAHRIRTTRSPGYWLHRARDRLHAEIHGDCIGSGIELPAFAAQVTATADLRVSLPEVSMGLVPGAGGTVSLPRRVGRHRTGYLAVSGEPIDAVTALAWGLVDEIV